MCVDAFTPPCLLPSHYMLLAELHCRKFGWCTKWQNRSIPKMLALESKHLLGGGRNGFSKLHPPDRLTSLRVFCVAFSYSNNTVSPFSKIYMNEN